MSARQPISEYHLDDSVDGGSTILDPADVTRLSFDQETYTAGASEYGGGGGGVAESVTGTEYANRLDLGNLNLVSWKNGASRRFLGGPTLADADDESGSDTPRLKFHAISELVCHPSKTPAPLRGSRKPLPPSSAGPPSIPKPPPDGFYQPYLDSIAKPLAVTQEQTGVESLWDAWNQARNNVKSSSQQQASLNPFQEPISPESQQDLPDLKAVLPMFFDPEFDLATPHIWQAIVGSDAASNTSASLSTTTTQHAQEDLSHQLDVLESHLVSEISQRTPAFFSALSNLQSLTDQTSSCLSRLTALRHELTELDKSTAIKGLAIVEKQEDLHVARITERALAEVDGVVGTLAVVTQVANEGDWVGAQEGLEDVGRWWLKFCAAEGLVGVGQHERNHVMQPPRTATNGKRLLTLVQEEEEEEGKDNNTSYSTAVGNLSLSRAPLETLLPITRLPAIQHFPTEMAEIAHTIHDQLELSFASVCAAVFDDPPSIELVSDNDQGPGVLDGSQSATTTTITTKQTALARKRWRIPREQEQRVRQSFSEQIRGLLLGFWKTDLGVSTASNDENGRTSRNTTNGTNQVSPGEESNPVNASTETFVARIENVWRLAVLKCIKEGMRHVLQLGGDGALVGGGDNPGEELTDANASGQAKGQSLAETLRDMPHQQFVVISERMYEAMMARVELVRVLGEVLGDLLQETRQNMTAFIETVLHSGVDLANARASKILLTRTERHAELPLSDFVHVYQAAWQFILWSEAIVGRVVGSLRGVAASQARLFLVKYHSARLQESAKLVEEEQWIQVDVPADAQRAVDLLVGSAMSDPIEYKMDQSSVAMDSNEKPDGQGVSAPKTAKTLMIEDQSFNVVSATLRSVVLLQDYAKVVVNLDVIVSDVMNRIIEYLKSFNSRTCQVVLGAGAMRSAGLKNITAKHLALASQSLSIVIALTPYIREFVRRHLNPKQAVVLIEFDKLKRDFQEHQYEIHAKLISIMADRLVVHCGSLRNIDWEAKSSLAVNSYMEQLVKEITTLHKVLYKYLAISSVHTIMGRVLEATNSRLGEEYSKVDLRSEDAKKRMMQDVSYLQERTKALTDSTAPLPTAPLEELVKSKSTPRRQMSSAINGLLRRKNDSASASVTSLHDIPDERPATSEKDPTAVDDEDDTLTATIVQPDMEGDLQQTAHNGSLNGDAGTDIPQVTISTDAQPGANGKPVSNTEHSTGQVETVQPEVDAQVRADSVEEKVDIR
ncbi:hypothetical protein QFC22_000137 [Naganishia vaughanmartiniae]|uniref:Uncharacterized protein n=1 Tax=Naganishia vaughanmartiniae TaxID=1424756 RepID=A0ACC2XMH1_9TREE|nr:hypothetical protein QFC22_000137 [Naganishia vaughanmartiniae]